jgi:ABC-type lipoprotein release transport system permease subunit
MAFAKLWTIAYRDLGRNRRRSILSLVAVALGLALLLIMNGYISGVTEEATQNEIRLRSGHVQIRAASYEEEQLSLQWEDLIDDPDTVVARAAALPEVKVAAPVLWATTILNTVDDSIGLRIYGIDVTSPLYAPIRESLVAGEFLQPDDRGGVVIGQRLADTMGLALGQNVNLTVINADGEPDEANFTVRGLFNTGVPSYDESAIFMPLARAQSFTVTNGHASAIVMMLNNQADAERAAGMLAAPEMKVLTWRDLNQVLLQTMETGMAFYLLLDLIVMVIVAVIIANTLLMAVFERIREMGILAALGMKGRQIMLMFLLEATILALGGIAVGIVLGSAGVGYLATQGIYLGEISSTAGNIALGSTIHGRFVPEQFVSLSLWTFIVILLASLYPAWFAIRREPADALRSA